MIGIQTIRILCLAPILLISFAWAQTGEGRISLIASALQNKDFEKALSLLQPALRTSPGNPKLWAMQGSAYVGEGHTKEALTSFHSALKISPDYLPALQGAAQIEFEAASPKAIPLIEHVIRLRPGDQTSHGMLAVLEYQQRNYAGAVAHFEKAGTLFDSQPAALHAYAICLVKLKQFDRAAEVFQRTVALNPDDRRERQLLAAIQMMAHKPTDAIATLGPLLQMSSPDAETLELASSAYEDAKDTSRAVSTLQQAILLDPHNVNLYLDFANISSTHGSYQVGINVINDGMALQPLAAPLYFARGVLYVQLAQYDQAEADFDKAYELDPNQSLSVAAQGFAAAQKNDFDHALGKVQAALARRPRDPMLLYLQADFLAEKNPDADSPEFQLAVNSARKAIALQPTLGAAQGVLAKLYLQSGKFQEAAVESRKAFASNPQDQTAIYHLVQALRRSGNQAEIPDLLKQLAALRKRAAKDESARYRYRLVEEDFTLVP
jgi:tetratricopeptide (TPR) repeat protein